MATATESGIGAEKPARKTLVRRRERDRSQQIRHGVQLAFLILNIWIGIQFYLFVRHHETGGATVAVARPAGVEGWLPIASLMNAKDWFLTGKIPEIHPAGMFLLLAFVTISLVMRKAFCGWLCPVGTVSEYLWKAGREAFGRNLVLPRWADIPLRGLKYLVMGFFVWAVVNMPVEGIRAFLASPFGLVSDVKMLNFFRFLGVTSAVVLGLLAALSFVIKNFWCRYLCPYGALMGLAAGLSPTRIRRNEEPCIDCGKCARACPSSLPVDRLVQIRTVECIGCMECVAVCPAEGALHLSLTRRRTVSPWVVAATVAVLFLGTVAGAKFSGHWETNVPAQVYDRLIPEASLLGHP